MKKILINANNKEEIRIAMTENGELVALDIESSSIQKNKGNVYQGKITRIENSLNAVFVDYGREKQGFLPLKDITPYHLALNNSQSAEGKKSTVNNLTVGQKLIVQVDKEERGSKGATLTTFVALPGAYSILMPYGNKGFAISRQISHSDKKDLKKELTKITMPEDYGLIVRTSGAGRTADELQWEVDYLLQLWKIIQQVHEKDEAPLLIYQENNIALRVLRDHLRENIEAVFVDDQEAFEQIKDFVTFVLPQYLDKLQLFQSDEQSLFEAMDVEKQVLSLFNKEVKLKSGGTLVFDATEALTAVDINSAKSNKGDDIEQTALHTNLEAAREIAKQCQLRDLGGLLVIDFIDMASKEHQNQVLNEMQQAIKGDRARIQMNEISEFGLLEMSRQRLKASVLESTKKVCSHCDGSGVVSTVPSLAVELLRTVETTLQDRQVMQVTVQASLDVITYILNEKRQSVITLEQRFGQKIVLIPNPNVEFPRYTINKSKKETSQKPYSYQKANQPQYAFAEKGWFDKVDKPVIDSTKPHRQLPRRKVGFLKRLFAFWQPQKPVKRKSNYRRPARKRYRQNQNQNRQKQK